MGAQYNLIVALMSILCGVADPQVGISDIRNADITWHKSVFGLGPRMNDKTLDYFKHATKSDAAELVRALNSRDRWLAAHVVLISLYGASDSLPNQVDDDDADQTYFSFGVRVIRKPGEPPQYNSSDQEILRKYWTTRLEIK